MTTLNIIGCGRAASTLARLWRQRGVVEIGAVLTRSHVGALAACDFVGGGRAVAEMAAMGPAGLWLLGVPDREIAAAARRLANCGLVRPGDGVFHLSGFGASALLAPLGTLGAGIASVHPVLSFAEPERALDQFAGTLCGVEGSADLCARLTDLFAAIGGHCFALDAAHKPLYHAGSVFASNFLVVIMDLARKAYLAAGVAPETADRLLAPLARGALANVIERGARHALTGPAARGDHAVVSAQQRAVTQWSGEAGEAYAALTALAYRLASERGSDAVPAGGPPTGGAPSLGEDAAQRQEGRPLSDRRPR